MEEIGFYVMRERKRKKMTQEELASLAKCNIITINRLENNKNVSYKIIKNVMDALGLEINITKTEQPQN